MPARSSELEQVIRIVGRCPRGYPPGACDALKGYRRTPSPEPRPAERTNPRPKAKGARDLRECRLLGFAHYHTANPQKTTLCRCFGNVSADLSKLTFESRWIARCLGINQCTDLP